MHIKSGFILNGVCVLWRGWVDLQRLEGFGCLEFDEYRAYLEDAMLKQQIDKQQACNNNSLMNHQNSPLSRLNHHPLGAGAHLSAAAAAAAVAANSLPPPVGLNPAACLGVGPPPPQQQQPPPPHLQQVVSQQGQLQANSLNCAMQAPLPPTVSLADSAAHYGNAAIAAAAAAAFHQALSVGAPPPPPPVPLPVQPSQPSSLAQLPAQSGPAQSQQQRLSHPSLAASGLLSTGANQHLSAYTTNGIPNGNNSCILPSNQAMTASQSNTNNNRPSLNGSTSSSSSSISSSGGVNKNNGSPSHSPLNHHHASSRSPEIENHLNSHLNNQQQQHHHNHQHHQQHHQQHHSHHQRQSTKRSHEELTQIDDVDVVSDIHSHDLDFPPRRIFKSAPITTGAIHHHRATRRA